MMTCPPNIFAYNQTMETNNERVLTAVEKDDGILDKEAISHDDLMDAFSMSMLFWH